VDLIFGTQLTLLNSLDILTVNIAKDDIIRYLDKVPTWVWIALATVGTLELLGAIIYLLGFTEGGVALGLWMWTYYKYSHP
jgi:hypothetical protein